MKYVLILLMSVVSSTALAQKPLSCEMQMLLSGLSAMERDKGVAREQTVVGINKEKELTKAEIKKILDRVYIQGKRQTPDQIKNDVYAKCQRGR